MLREGQAVDVFVTHVEKAGKYACLWAQVDKEEGDQLESLMNDVQSRASNLAVVHADNLEPGDICLALYPEDRKWYAWFYFRKF